MKKIKTFIAGLIFLVIFLLVLGGMIEIAGMINNKIEPIMWNLIRSFPETVNIISSLLMILFVVVFGIVIYELGEIIQGTWKEGKKK